jgi:S1-C subfamily serine protease
MRQNGPLPSIRSKSKSDSLPPPPKMGFLHQRWHNFYRHWNIALYIGVGIITAFLVMFFYTKTQPPAQHLTQRDINNAVARAMASPTPTPSFESQAFSTIHPSMVSIETEVPKPNGKIEHNEGSGVVIDDSGNILTCLHVVVDAAKIRVTFADGTESEASIALQAEDNDLALLRPEVIPDNLVPATLVASSSLQVGDNVVAVGNPFGITNSLSSGVVSGLGRSFKSPETGKRLTGLIQFDAAVNPGNSGGPLVNQLGEVVGVVDALLNPMGQDFFIGIGFAVPIESAGGVLGEPWY